MLLCRRRVDIVREQALFRNHEPLSFLLPSGNERYPLLQFLAELRQIRAVDHAVLDHRQQVYRHLRAGVSAQAFVQAALLLLYRPLRRPRTVLRVCGLGR